ncbi:intercellular adhesion molecule 4-like isoform X1 [Synchiropus splendidus]|uniref:intercellular adhesion molecule 4-like isoform X1 n=2 Tax=Synchiropus splendidus TaxID=270530 RepID=UPI00237DF60B|nr:intercellular adhesion molecule 4-like isoform X1 [Synchiropus splendidus]XP_053712469.1 intercellular adhesion molecule 4-like isoform X1 [Synchiropus splendidus]
MSDERRMRTSVMLVCLLSSVSPSPVPTFTAAPSLPSQISPPTSLATVLSRGSLSSPSPVATMPPIPSSTSSHGETTDPHCPLKVTPDSVVVRFGDPVTVNCSVSKRENVFLTWEIPQLGLNTGLTEEPFQIWMMENVTEWDIKPMCYVTSDLGGHCYINLSVVVYKPPDSVTLSLANHTGPLLEMHQYSLECLVQEVAPVGNLTVTFYRGDTELQSVRSQNPEKMPVTEIFTVKIAPSKEDDGVEYWCEARLDLESKRLTVESQKLATEVLFGPHFLCPRKQHYKIGEQLSCEVEGNPTPSVKWLKDGQPFIPPTRLTKAHAGKYTISATGLRGQQNMTVEVALQCGNGGTIIHDQTLPMTVLLLQMCTFLSNVNSAAIPFLD